MSQHGKLPEKIVRLSGREGIHGWRADLDRLQHSRFDVHFEHLQWRNDEEISEAYGARQ